MWHRRAKKGSLFCPFGTEGETATVKIELLIYGRFLQKGTFHVRHAQKNGPLLKKVPFERPPKWREKKKKKNPPLLFRTPKSWWRRRRLYDKRSFALFVGGGASRGGGGGKRRKVHFGTLLHFPHTFGQKKERKNKEKVLKRTLWATNKF